MDEKYQTACDKGKNLTYKRIKLVGTCKHRFSNTNWLTLI